MTTRVVTTLWVDTFSADLVALAVGLSALAEHLEEGRWLFAGDDIHVPLNWVTSIVQSVPIPPYNKFRTVRIPRYYGTLQSANQWLTSNLLTRTPRELNMLKKTHIC